MSKPTRSVIQPVILCGGSGTRLWPSSRPEKPKPFLDLFGERTLFQEALSRVNTPMFASPLIVAGRDHVNLVTIQADEHRMIVEPARRNTAPAIALAAARLRRDAIMLVCPADHYIAGEEAFRDAVNDAVSLAEEDFLVCLGVEPTRPETGYGYIEPGQPADPGFTIARFIEKPGADLAASLIGGKAVWNAGIFVFRARTYLDQLELHRPEMMKLVSASVAGGVEQNHRFYPAEEPFHAIESESIDHAVMERTRKAAFVRAEMGWSDIGDWKAVMAARQTDGRANVVSGSARLVDCKGVMVQSDGPRVSVLGMENVVVVLEGNELLVVSRDRVQHVSAFAKSATE